jgi:starvation-inducible DNA-binding protein
MGAGGPAQDEEDIAVIRSALPEDAQKVAGEALHGAVVPQPPVAWIHADNAIRYFVQVFEATVTRMRDPMDATESDEVTQDLIIEITGALERRWWMWQAETATD